MPLREPSTESARQVAGSRVIGHRCAALSVGVRCAPYIKRPGSADTPRARTKEDGSMAAPNANGGRYLSALSLTNRTYNALNPAGVFEISELLAMSDEK